MFLIDNESTDNEGQNLLRHLGKRGLDTTILLWPLQLHFKLGSLYPTLPIQCCTTAKLSVCGKGNPTLVRWRGIFLVSGGSN